MKGGTGKELSKALGWSRGGAAGCKLLQPYAGQGWLLRQSETSVEALGGHLDAASPRIDLYREMRWAMSVRDSWGPGHQQFQ